MHPNGPARPSPRSAQTIAVHKGWSKFACFAGSEQFMTPSGSRKFRDAVGESVVVLDGNRQWTEAEVRWFGKQRLVRLTVTRGLERREIMTTAEHRWFVNPNANNGRNIEKLTTDLAPGVRLAYVAMKNKILEGLDPLLWAFAPAWCSATARDSGVRMAGCTVEPVMSSSSGARSRYARGSTGSARRASLTAKPPIETRSS